MALVFGVALGNIISGVPLDQQGNIHTSLIALFTPFALLLGVTSVFMLATHGGIYLTLKTEGALQARVRRLVPRLLLVFFILNTLVVAAAFLLHEQIRNEYLTHLWLAIFPALALVAAIAAWQFLRRGEDFRAFVCSGLMIAALIISVGAGLFPNLLLSNINPAYNLTAYNAASQPNTLAVMLVFAVIGMPFVLLYTAGVNYIFRGKVELSERSY
jgi:cytochrome d ubiquinol oxidase subunit II